MIRIALVGNIACGKSTVQNFLTDLNYKVLDTDVVCHSILEKSDKIKTLFKNYDVFDEDNNISRDKLGKLVFNEPTLKKELENCIYPELTTEILRFFEANNSEKITFVAIPLLFETNMENFFNKIIFIYCDDNIRLERLIKRNNYSKEYAKIRMNSQQPQEEKITKSDFVINNNSSFDDLKSQIIKIIEQIH